MHNLNRQGWTIGLCSLILGLVLVAGCSKSQAPETVSNTTDSTATTSAPAAPGATDGASLFASNCARCHGAQGEGKQGGMMTVPTLKGKSQDEVVTMATTGKGRMPSFKGRLSDEQIKAIAEYVSTKLGQ